MGTHADFSLFPPCGAGQAGRQVFWGGCRPASFCVFVSVSFRCMCACFDAGCKRLLLHFLGATSAYRLQTLVMEEIMAVMEATALRHPLYSHLLN